MTVSVALCTYNGAKFIVEQLNSILNQTVAVDEIVICDDNSKDNTLELADSVLKASGVKYQILVNNPPLGVSYNFLKALKHTTGDYVFTCDQDDVWNENKVELFATAAKEGHKDLYFSDGALVDGQRQPLGINLWESILLNFTSPFIPNFVELLIRRPIVTGAAMMVSRDLINKISDIPSGILHDEWFSMVAGVNDSAVAICTPTFEYRQHGNNVLGVKKHSFFERISIWYKNLLDLQPLREKELLRAKAIASAAKGTRYEALTNDALDFWTIVNSFSSLGRFKQIKLSIKLFTKKQYSKFYTGFRGFVRDILSALL